MRQKQFWMARNVKNFIYKNKSCLICDKIFSPKTSRHLTCSSECALVSIRARKNEYSKKYHDKKKQDLSYLISINIRKHLNKILRKRDKKYSKYLNYEIDFFIKNIESKFKEGMTWNNYGKWHLDHIIPLSSFNFANDNKENLKEIYRANSVENLQPLWAKENLKKHNKIL